MPESVPSLLAPYIHEALGASSSTLVTSTLRTPANWLLVRLLFAALGGLIDAGIRTNTGLEAKRSSQVIFVSLTKSLDLWIELCKRSGFDLASLLKSKTLTYIDGLPTLNSSSSDNGVVQMKGFTLEAMTDAVSSALNPDTTSTSQNPAGVDTTSEPTIIIDGLDILCASQPDFDITTIQISLFKLRSRANALIMTSNADAPLLHNHQDNETPLERNHATLVGSLAHQSQWVMQLRALGTGSAKDVTGVLRISKGGDYEAMRDQKADLDETEWLYQVKGDGSARVWSRGE